MKKKHIFPSIIVLLVTMLFFYKFIEEEKEFFLVDVMNSNISMVSICFIVGDNISKKCKAVTNLEKIKNIVNSLTKSKNVFAGPGNTPIREKMVIKFHIPKMQVCYLMTKYEGIDHLIYLTKIETDASCNNVIRILSRKVAIDSNVNL